MVDELTATQNGPPPEPEAPAGPEWLTNKQGKEYVRIPGRRGVIYRAGPEETVTEAIQRGEQQRDQPPRRRQSKTARKPPAPKRIELKELEGVLAEAFQAPAMPCAAFGDEWAANHFTSQGPVLARNLVHAAQFNPWLRKQLESAAEGGDTAMKLMTAAGVGGALFAYAIPPAIWWLNLKVPDQARIMFGIPPRRRDDASSQTYTQAAAA